MDKHQLPNEACRRQAKHAIECEDYHLAIAWINTATARTFGHKKAKRYRTWADNVAIAYGIERHNEYANDSQAVSL